MGIVASGFFVILPSCDVGSVMGWGYIYDSYVRYVQIGILVSTLFVPALLNHAGRRCSFLVMILFVYIGLLMKFFYPRKAIMLMFAKIISGVGCGFYIQFVLVYFSEISGRKTRGMLLCVPLMLISIFTMIYFALEPHHPYPIFFNFASGAISFLGTFIFLRESPYYLVSLNEYPKARIVLEHVRGMDEDIQRELLHMTYEVRSYGRRMVAQCPFCAYQEMMERTAIIVLVTTLTLLAFGGQPIFHIYLRWQWYNLTTYMLHSAAILGGSLLAVGLVDIAGRKFIALCSSGLMLAALIGFYLLNFMGYDFEYPYNEGIINGIYHIGMYYVPFLLMAESYPYVLRARAVACHLFLYICLENLGRFINIYIYFNCPINVYYIFCCIFVLTYFLVVFFLLPELARRSLFRTQVYLDQFR